MDSLLIFSIQITLSLVVFILLARAFFVPFLKTMAFNKALIALLFFHAFRYIGMTIMVPEVSDPALPTAFTEVLAYGNLLLSLLVITGILLLQQNKNAAFLIVWLYNIAGLAGIIWVASRAMKLDIVHYQLGATWFIPTFYMPLLLVTHVIMIRMLMNRKQWTS